ncbi:hypothetical protein BDP27DRAFT_1321186 [Rhodocollybia butyracea]|uniref:Uncharacterized protein n=1 Tax=Rhodocollybia butyracea TaxID=206335 RepID=A0A9P5Q103_9AGAR|nr:hypothetical protein BDP27DRAFT_1321186 [Rhodocollybia butyracea]
MSLGTTPPTRRSFLSLFFAFAWFSFFTFTIRPVKAQTTIDDAQSAFSFASAWNVITPSDPCSGCAFKPDASQILDGTWHEGSVAGSTGSLTFDGTGVSLFGVVNGAETCAMTFVLDGVTSSLDLSAIPPSVKTYNYQYFAQNGLSTGAHTLSWTIGASVDNAIALIDYAVVTSAAAVAAPVGTTNPGSSPTPSSPAGAQTTTVTSQASASSSSNTQLSSSSPIPGSGSPTSSSQPNSSSPNSTIGTSLVTSMVISSATSTPAADVSLAPQKPKTALIVGAVLGSVLGLVLAFALLFLILRRRRRRSKTPKSTPFYYNRQLDEVILREDGLLQKVYPPEKVAPISSSRAPSRINTTRPPNNGTTMVTGASPENSSVEPSTTIGPIQHMEQRILLLERIFQQTNQGDIMLPDDTSPPPY